MSNAYERLSEIEEIIFRFGNKEIIGDLDENGFTGIVRVKDDLSGFKGEEKSNRKQKASKHR